MLLLREDALAARRALTREGGPLAPTYESLAAELAPLLGVDPFIPGEKAMLSRAGGRCGVDAAPLAFDPASPTRHHCDRCGRTYTGESHDRAWIMPYQLWLAERAVHAALFHVLRGDARHAALARDIVTAYADRYLGYPNSDNVLGPSRLFFSTYLESVWLLQICIASDLLAIAGDGTTAGIARDRIIEPARAIIATYDEGTSNRQVWNNAALLAAAAVLNEGRTVDRVMHAASGPLAHLSRALLADGTWYEGENYHQFALRGLWYAVAMLEARGTPLSEPVRDRFQRAFSAPFLTALPDFTMPSRKDSQYAVSLRQWRFAELAELGFARRREPVLAGALARCYESGHERRDTGRARSTADIERNGPSGALTRADLGWRALLHAVPELPALPPHEPRSTLMTAQGFAVFRRERGVYVGVDYGQSGGGHGHPDRLNLTLYQGAARWLDDLGTGSYVDPSLHWYRSTLAHNAPLVDGKSQPARDGSLVAYDEREGLGWIVAQFRIPDGDVAFERAVIVAPDYLIDELRWTAAREIRIDLPWHLDGPPVDGMQPVALAGGSAPEDGFAFVSEPAGLPARIEVPSIAGPRRSVVVATYADQPVMLFAARAPGQPPPTLRRFFIVRTSGRAGRLRSVVSWTQGLQLRGEAGALTIEYPDGERHVHRRDEHGWHAELFAASARSSIDLAGFTPPPVDPPPAETFRVPDVPMRVHRSPIAAGWLSELRAGERDPLLVYELGEPHYRRSEASWEEAGRPSATVALGASDRSLVLFANVAAGDPSFAPADATNPLDNEQADTMRAGVQLYVRAPSGNGGWMLVPESDGGHVRIRVIGGWGGGGGGGESLPSARWRMTPAGYEMRIELPLPAGAGASRVPIALDLVVNETTADRVRRRGQLVLSGARGEFVYLRGDRHDVERLVPLEIVP